MQTSTQRGSGALVMVMMILLMGTLMLTTTRRQLDDSMSLVGDERHYLQQFTGAMSALAWGERLHWVAAEEWHCQQQVDITGVPVFSPLINYCAVTVGQIRWHFIAGSVSKRTGLYRHSRTAGWITAP